ncbi:unnamed protein product [Prunus armeniaca]|uniref:Uncharacterized protein n=1 Tax=Prunus armeniaca TaxID=36596 RepID=A0A6J5USJ5_PRUAR|nr:unnamed protein product [Prunus armeniaca]
MGELVSYPTWNDIPDDILDDIWKDITDNTDAPEAYRFHFLKVVGNRWRDWKCRLKQKWYYKYDTDEQRLAITPPRVVTEQWKTLECSEMNKVNRAQGGAPHRTGRISFAQLRNVMREKGEKTDRLSMFIKTRTKKKNDEDEVFDEDNADIINQFNQCLEEREEDEQDESFREEISTKVMGTYAHGRVRMCGAGVTPSQVFGQKSNSDNNENRMREELEKQCQSKIDDLQSKLNEVSSQLSQVMTHVGFQTTPEESGSSQIPDASSMHQRRLSVNSDLQPNLDLEA